VAHDQLHGHLPSGGWGWGWQGDPDRGYGSKQPGGWVYNILPHIEGSNLRPLTGSGVGGKREQIRRLAEVPIPLMHCVSRRRPFAYPFRRPEPFFNIERPEILARTDYDANNGDLTLEEADNGTYQWPKGIFTGICFRRSQISFADIADGATNTYMVGEAYLNPSHYSDGMAINDNEGMYVGFDHDTVRVAHKDYPPMRDTVGVENSDGFGSAHLSGFNMAFCDGSVRVVRYDVDRELHRASANREDVSR
jgi:prepilin-type processing-associated H-X9-DG protein